MTYEELKVKGTFINEQDRYGRGTYEGTSYYYVCNNNLYVREEHTNQNSYTGKTSTYIMIDNVDEALKKYNRDYFETMMNAETYDKLCKLF